MTTQNRSSNSSVFSSIKKLLWLPVLLAIVGGGIGYSVSQVLTPVYEVTLDLYSELFVNQHYKKNLQELQVAISNENHQKVAELMELPLGSVTHIKSIDITVDDKEKEYFQVNIEITDSSINKQVAEGVLRHFEKVDLNNKQYQLKKAQLEQVIANKKQNLNSLDTLKSAVLAKVRSSVSGIVVDPADAFTAHSGMNESMLNNQLELDELSIVTELKKAYMPIKPISPKPLLNLILGAALFSFIGIAVILYKVSALF